MWQISSIYRALPRFHYLFYSINYRMYFYGTPLLYFELYGVWPHYFGVICISPQTILSHISDTSLYILSATLIYTHVDAFNLVLIPVIVKVSSRVVQWSWNMRTLDEKNDYVLFLQSCSENSPNKILLDMNLEKNIVICLFIVLDKDLMMPWW